MDSPLNNVSEQANRPTCLDISPKRIDAMSPSELADAMEQAIDAMTEETYDPVVIDAYLDALERKSPIPDHPGVHTAYADFQKKLQPLASVGTQSKRQPHTKSSFRFRRVFRVGLVAAITVACLFGSMVIVQASGLDVFGAMARWTESVFSFGTLPGEDVSNNPSDPQDETADIPEEYKELQAILEKRRLPLYFPKVPAEFEVQDSYLYIDPTTRNVKFFLSYMQGTDYISFNIIQNGTTFATIYEKDNSSVEPYEYNGITHYIFSDLENLKVVWTTENVEYCISINSTSVDIKALIQSLYEE